MLELQLTYDTNERDLYTIMAYNLTVGHWLDAYKPSYILVQLIEALMLESYRAFGVTVCYVV